MLLASYDSVGQRGGRDLCPRSYFRTLNFCIYSGSLRSLLSSNGSATRRFSIDRRFDWFHTEIRRRSTVIQRFLSISPVVIQQQHSTATVPTVLQQLFGTLQQLGSSLTADRRSNISVQLWMSSMLLSVFLLCCAAVS